MHSYAIAHEAFVLCRSSTSISSVPLHSLQNECQVSLNTVDSVETFVSDITNGRWDVLLPQVAQLKLPRAKLENLYEQVSSVSEHTAQS